jgi:spoIIIJ-associated protein
MQVSKEFSAKTEDEAINIALAELGLSRDDVSIEIVERSRSGFLGLGATPAVVRVFYEEKSSEEDIEDKAKEFLSGMLEHMGARANINVSERNGRGIILSLTGDSMGMIIGRRGETLDAIQHLTNYAANRRAEKRVHVTVDVENYRQKREESLARLAEKTAAKVIKDRNSMALEPMNSYERHVIHTALQEYEGVSTGSTGTEPNRRVVINYTGVSEEQSRQSTTSREWS